MFCCCCFVCVCYCCCCCFVCCCLCVCVSFYCFLFFSLPTVLNSITFLGCRQSYHGQAQADGTSGTQKHVQPLLPVLLALRDTSHIQGSAQLVCARGDSHPSTPGEQQQVLLGAGLCEGETVPQLAQGRSGLGYI